MTRLEVALGITASALDPVERRIVEEKLAREYEFVPRGAPSPQSAREAV